jgi:hypothetical protein
MPFVADRTAIWVKLPLAFAGSDEGVAQLGISYLAVTGGDLAANVE